MSDTIIINATNLGRHTTGIGVYVLNFLRELSQLRTDHRFIIYLNRNATEHIREMRFSERCTIRWVSSLVSPDYGFRGHLPRLLYSNYIALKHRTSLVFVTSQLEAVFVTSNHVVTVHDIIPLLFKSYHRKQYYYYKYMLPRVLRKAKWVITPSQHTKDLLMKVYRLDGSHIHVIHHGVRESLPPVGLSEQMGEKFILYMGRIVRSKNVAGVLRAFDALKDRIPHSLIITGEGTPRVLKELAPPDLVMSSRGDSRIIFKGHLSEKEIEDLLSRASLLIFPSFYEGFGLPPLEGMAHGCPVVVSNVSSLPEVCGDAARYVDPNDVRSIVEGIYTMLTNVQLRQRLIARGLERARMFRWRDSVEEHLRVFETAMQNQHECSRPARDQWHRFLPAWVGLNRPASRSSPGMSVTEFGTPPHCA